MAVPRCWFEEPETADVVGRMKSLPVESRLSLRVGEGPLVVYEHPGVAYMCLVMYLGGGDLFMNLVKYPAFLFF